MRFENDTFQLYQLVAPQPVAIACGSVVRSRSPQDRFDAIIRCAEVLTRYLAAVSLASFAARDDPQIPPPGALQQFRGNLSFGHFLSVVQAVAQLTCDHPIKSAVTGGFKATGGTPGPADAALTSLLELRNASLGHGLMSSSEARAISVFETEHPDALLISALQALDPVLRYPLFLLEQQVWERDQFIARRLLLMGENPDPSPDEIGLTKGLKRSRELYVGLAGTALCLFPWLRWQVATQRKTFSIYLLHQSNERELNYRTVHDDDGSYNGDGQTAARTILDGSPVPSEETQLHTGSGLFQEWNTKRRLLEQTREIRVIPWERCDEEWITWYGRKLESGPSLEDAKQAIIRDLLDGREELDPHEVRQFILLLGTQQAVRQTIRRDVIDLRVRKSPDVRFDERVESGANVLHSLRLAVEFLGRHINLDQPDLDHLGQTTGTADYIATREGLVNLFVHQDYEDARTVAQVELTTDQATFFNAGRSLVKDDTLFAGARSQSRNPLLSRALKLIGFAELAGSGLRTLNQAWTGVKRRPPEVRSDAKSNTFTLLLDWRPTPDTSVEFWRERLGARISPLESEVLALLASVDSMGPDALSAALGVHSDEVGPAVQNLERQGMVRRDGSEVSLREDLKPLVEEAKNWGADTQR